jgi:hypothetical protein
LTNTQTLKNCRNLLRLLSVSSIYFTNSPIQSYFLRKCSLILRERSNCLVIHGIVKSQTEATSVEKSDRGDICWKDGFGRKLAPDWLKQCYAQPKCQTFSFSWFFLLNGWCCFLAWVLFDLLFFIHIDKCRYSSIRYQKRRPKKTSLTGTSSLDGKLLLTDWSNVKSDKNVKLAVFWFGVCSIFYFYSCRQVKIFVDTSSKT